MGKISQIYNFDNVGRKIQTYAKWSCWITILLIWIAAPIALVVLDAELCWIPIVAALVLPFLVWVGSWAMYAFGEFVEDIHAMRKKYYPIAEEEARRYAEEEARREEEKRAAKFACPGCGNVVHYGDATCQHCGQTFNWNKI